MDKLAMLIETIESIATDTTKFFEKGNKAAGTRARKNLQEVKKIAQELRVAIQDTKCILTSNMPEDEMDETEMTFDSFMPSISAEELQFLTPQ